MHLNKKSMENAFFIPVDFTNFVPEYFLSKMNFSMTGSAVTQSGHQETPVSGFLAPVNRTRSGLAVLTSARLVTFRTSILSELCVEIACLKSVCKSKVCKHRVNVVYIYRKLNFLRVL